MQTNWAYARSHLQQNKAHAPCTHASKASILGWLARLAAWCTVPQAQPSQQRSEVARLPPTFRRPCIHEPGCLRAIWWRAACAQHSAQPL